MLTGNAEPLPSVCLGGLRGLWSITLQLGPFCIQHTLKHR